MDRVNMRVPGEIFDVESKNSIDVVNGHGCYQPRIEYLLPQNVMSDH